MIFFKYFQFFTEGSMLGFATGISCAVFCLPVLIGLTSRNVNNITPVIDIIYFLAGRLFAYIFVGIFFSFIGMHLKFASIIDVVSKFIITVLLVYWGIKGFIETDNENKNCSIKKFSKTVPLLAGMITGISPCPPFIAGITRVIGVGDIFMGILYFTGFYLTTSIFLIPAFVTGLAKYKKELKLIASFVSIIFGVIFLFMAIFKISSLS